MTRVHAMSAEDVHAMLAHVFNVLLHQRPTYSMRSPQSWRKSLANVCESVLVDTLAALLQSGDSIIVDVSGDGNVVVLNGDKEVSAKIDAIPAGIS